MRIVCISHGKDADGICAAALVRMATGSETIPSDYGDVLEVLRGIENVDELYICDLGFDSRGTEFLQELSRISRGATVTYIDHHHMGARLRKGLESLGVRTIHSVRNCASMLAYLHFGRRLPREAGLLACYGAVTDYLDRSAEALRQIARFDRQFVLFEATILSYAIGQSSKSPERLVRLVSELSRMNHPHQIGDVPSLALQHGDEMANLIKDVRERGVKTGRIAHFQCDGAPTGGAASLLLGAFEVPVGVAYRTTRDRCEISLRASQDSRVHLGRIAKDLAERLGGFGGGHRRACGAMISPSRLDEFLRKLEKRLEEEYARG